MNEEGAKLREDWIANAEILLGERKGHMGIITYLRDQGLHADDAKRVSYEIFDEAKKRLMRSISLMFSSPLIFGVIILGRIVNPSRFPD